MADEAFHARLVAGGLAKHATSLAALVRSSIRLRPEQVDESELEIGASKLGGLPDLPGSFVWPSYDDLPQSFVAQVNLGALHPYDVDGVLPAAGVLSFFYDSQQGVWGFDPAQAGGWAVHYSPATADLVRCALPVDLPEEGRFRSLALTATVEPTYAPWEFSEVDALGLTREERFAYADLIDQENGPLHRLLGHPNPVQGDMQLECQLASNGLSCGDSTGNRDPRADELRPGAADWRLLLQVDTDDEAGMMWGDTGMIYYWMHKDSLASHEWGKSWFGLQCC